MSVVPLDTDNEVSNFACVPPRLMYAKLLLFASQWAGTGDRADAVKTEELTKEESGKLYSTFTHSERQVVAQAKNLYHGWNPLLLTLIGLRNDQPEVTRYAETFPERHIIWRHYFGLPYLDPTNARDRVLLNLCYLWDARRDNSYARSVKHKLTSRWKLMNRSLRLQGGPEPGDFPIFFEVDLSRLIQPLCSQAFQTWISIYVTRDRFQEFLMRHYHIKLELDDNKQITVDLVSLTVPECERVAKALRRSVRFWFDLFTRQESLAEFMDAE